MKEERDAGGAMGAKPPPGPVKLLISGGFQAPTGAEPPLLKKKQNLSPPPDKFLNTPRPFAGDL